MQKLFSVAVLLAAAMPAAYAQQPAKPNPELQACQAKLGSEINSGLQMGTAVFTMEARIKELEKELADEKTKTAKPKE